VIVELERAFAPMRVLARVLGVVRHAGVQP
jgi:acetolactate synthase regulatory subunit